MRSAWAILLIAALAGCGVYLPEPDLGMAGGDEARLTGLRRGRELYINKCSGCHALFPADRFDDARWSSEVGEMIRLKKVRMGEEERDRLLWYLTAANGR